MNDVHTPVDVAAARFAEGAVRIEVVRGLSERPAWTLPPGVWQVGRGRGVAVRLEDPAVSRVHCTLHVGADGRVRVEDAGSGNGTRLGGRAVPGEAEWDPSKLLEVGRVALRLVPSAHKRRRAKSRPIPSTEQEAATGDATTEAIAALVGPSRARRWLTGIALAALLAGLGVWTWMAPPHRRAPASDEGEASSRRDTAAAGAGAETRAPDDEHREPSGAAATRARALRDADPVRALAWYEVARATQPERPGVGANERADGLFEAMRWEAARGSPWRPAQLDRHELPEAALDVALSVPWRVRVLAARMRLRREEVTEEIERIRAALVRGDLGAARAEMGSADRAGAGALSDPELAGLRALIERGDAVEAARAVRPEPVRGGKPSQAAARQAFDEALRRGAYGEAWRLGWQALRTATGGAERTWRTRLMALEDARVHRLLADRWSDAGRHALAAAHLLEAAADLEHIQKGAGGPARHEAADLLAAAAAAAQAKSACSSAVAYAAAALALDASQALARRVRAWCRQEGERAMAQALLAAQSARPGAARAWALDALAALPDNHPMRARLREIAGNDPPPQAP